MKRPPAPPARPARPWWRRETLVCAALLVVAGTLVYAHGLANPFLFDDHTAIVENRQIREVWPPTAALTPPRETPVAGRPLVNLSLAVNYAMGGLDPRPYHATNLLIHLLASLALFGVIRRGLAFAPVDAIRAQALTLAFVCALIWMLHPVQSEVVNYVTQRTTSLKALLMLTTMYASIRALTAGSSRRRWYIVGVLSCAAGMACKESMAVAPVLVVLFDRLLVYPTFGRAFRERRGFYAGLAATWLVLAWLLSGVPRTTAGFGSGVSAWTYLLNQAVMIVHYLRLVVWPRGLVIDYGLPQPLDLRDVLLPFLAVSAMGLATVVALIRRPALGFAGAWFFITLAPTSSIVPIATEVGAERRMYVPLAALVVLLVCGAFLAGRALRLGRAAAGVACVLVCALLTTGSIARTHEYRSRLSMAQTVVERRPHGRAFLRLGALLLAEGRRPEALAYLKRARAVDALGSRFALGTEYLVDGDFDRGIAELQEFVRLYPRHMNVIPALEMLGQTHLAHGRLEEAAQAYAQILTLVPQHQVAHDALGGIRFEQRRPLEALPHLAQVASARPADADAWGRLGAALASVGRIDDAIEAFSRSVASAPQNARAHRMLGQALAERGRMDQAAAHLQQAVELAPDDELARRLLDDATRFAR